VSLKALVICDQLLPPKALDSLGVILSFTSRELCVLLAVLGGGRSGSGHGCRRMD
jgi:hypothetical protein